MRVLTGCSGTGDGAASVYGAKETGVPTAWGVYGPRRPLPLPVPQLIGESTGSFVNRLAHHNGLQLHEFLDRVGQGQASKDPAQIGKYPQVTEMYVNAEGLRYLAVLTGTLQVDLRRALPSLAERRLLPDAEAARWKWRWEPHEGHLVLCCALCTHERGIEEPAWLMSPDSWQVCPRHLRWTDNSRSTDPAFVGLEKLPETIQAHRQRQHLQLRFGRVGEDLFADAFQVAAHWWTTLPNTARWVQRAWSAGLEARQVRAAPLVIYPEAAELAQFMLQFEQAGERDRAAGAQWLSGVQRLMDRWDVDFRGGREPLLVWLERHSRPTPALTARSPGPGLHRGLPPPGKGGVSAPAGSLGTRSCLPWELGMAAAEL